MINGLPQASWYHDIRSSKSDILSKTGDDADESESLTPLPANYRSNRIK